MFSRNKIAMVVAEILGTAILTTVILVVGRSQIGLPYFISLAAGITLAMLVLTVGPASGAHANPALTLGLWTVKKISTLKAVVYVAAQFVGAGLAWLLYSYLIDNTVKSIAGKDFDVHVLVAELVGTAIFTFGVAAAIYRNYEGGKLAATIGGSLLLGIMIASVASNGMINPAVALGARSWSKAYVFGPFIGAIVGVNLFAFLFATPEASKPARLTAAKTSSRAKTTTRKTAAKKKTSTRKKR